MRRLTISLDDALAETFDRMVCQNLQFMNEAVNRRFAPMNEAFTRHWEWEFGE